ncbi:hypothetical protein PENCOP_c001G07690 [Penicillium coprophilum]|uniref:Uncharacterized protein n=1 Tax=Penicillium coprophilum TaxID=36646 RepID=A0A1V6V6P1_9EURO|nr:hypothetical protein PENCOP_c001G07690 [Penicillium coprophilum]
MTAVNWIDFGICPLRCSTKAFRPFANKGVNAADRGDWVFSRFLIKPFFNRDVYTNTDRIRPYVDSLLSLLPPDREIFNIQPLLMRWFLDLTLGEPKGALNHPAKAKITWAMLDVLRGSRQRMQVVRMIKWFNWDWWLKARLKEIETRKARITVGGRLGPEQEDLLWYTASHDSDYEDLRSQLALLLVLNNVKT